MPRDVDPFDPMAADETAPVAVAAKATRADPFDPLAGDPVAPAAPAAPETNTASRLGTAVGQGTVKGLSGIVGAPVDLASAGLRAVGVPVPQAPVGGSQSIRNAIESVLDVGRSVLPDALVNRNFTPQTPAERIAGRVGEEVGSNVPFVGGVLGAANKLGATAAQGVAAPLINPARVAPGAATAADMGYATTAGLGAGAAREAASNDPGIFGDLADFAGAFVGGVAPAAVVGAARKLPDVVPMTADSRATAAGKKLGVDVDPERVGKLDEAVKEAPEIPGFRYGTAELLNDPELLVLKRRLERQVDPAASVEKRQANAEAAKTFVEAETPAGNTAAPAQAIERQRAAVDKRLGERVGQTEADVAARNEAVQQAARERVAQIREAEAAAAAKLKAETETRLGAAREGVDTSFRTASPAARSAEDASVAARTELETAKEEAKAGARALYDQADPAGDLALPTTRVEEAIGSVVRRAIAAGHEEAIPDIILSGKIDAFLGVQPMARIEGLRQTLGEQARKLFRAGDERAAGYVGQLKSSIDRLYDDLAAGKLSATIATDAAPAAKSVAGDLSEQQLREALESLRAEWQASRATQAPSGQQRIYASGEPAGAADTGRASGAGRTPERQSEASAQGQGSPRGSGQAGSLEPNIDPAAAQRFRDARLNWLENYKQPFKEGSAGKVLKTGPDGRPAVAPTATLRQFAKPRSAAGAEEAAQDFIRAVGGREAATQAMRDFLVDTMRTTAKEGRVNARIYNDFIDSYAPILDRMPAVKRDLGTVAKAQAEVDRLAKEAPDLIAAQEKAGREAVRQAEKGADAEIRQAEREGKETVKKAEGRQKASTAAIDKSAAKYWLNRDPESAVQGILDGGDAVQRAKETMSLVRKDPSAVKGVNRATWEYLTKKMLSAVEDEGVRLDASARLLRDKGPALEILLGGKEQFDKAKKLLDAATITTRANRANVRGGSDSIQSAEGMIEKGIKDSRTLLAIFGGGMMGGPIGSALGWVGGKATDAALKRQRDAIDSLMLEALSNPEVYKTLTMQVNRANERVVANRLRQHIASFGLRQADTDDE